MLNSILEKSKANKKLLSVLIDPDKFINFHAVDELIKLGSDLDFYLIGGSLLVSDRLEEIVNYLKQQTSIPVVLFPGSNLHISKQADAILFLSLISGRNPELLIGQHVSAAPVLKESNLEVLSTGYILVGNAAKTTVAYISQTLPIPTAKSEIAVCTAMAGEMLGMKLIYLDAGSGSDEVVPAKMISEVKRSVDIPLIVGGGLNTRDKVKDAYDAGADTIVLGTAIEHNAKFLKEALAIRDEFNA